MPNPNDMFPHLVDAAVAMNPRARQFTITDNRRVLVEGLESIESVEIDRCPMPLMEDRPFWIQNPGKEPEVVTHMVPLVIVQDIPGVGRCLIRSVYSNHGEWQIGSQVTVIGDWNEDPSEHFISNLVVHEEMAKRDANHAAELDAKDAEIAELRKKIEDKKSKKATEESDADAAAKKAELDAKDAEIKKLHEEAGGAPVELTDDETKARAVELKINPRGKSFDKLRELIAAKEAEGD